MGKNELADTWHRGLSSQAWRLTRGIARACKGATFRTYGQIASIPTMEQWLEHADRQLTHQLHQGVPTSIEQLEEVIQDHREFLLNLDSHKSVAMSINVVGSHLADHSPTKTKAEAMNNRLAGINDKWDNVCEQATLWQTRLQAALLQVRQVSFRVSVFRFVSFRMESSTPP